MSLDNYPNMLPKSERVSGKGKFLCSDMEAEGLLDALRFNDPTCIHTLSIRDMFTQEKFIFFDPYEKRNETTRIHIEHEGHQDGYLVDALEMLMEAEAICFQNGVGYDMLALEKVFPNKWKFNYLEARGKDKENSAYFPRKLMDTMIISQLLNPDRRAPPQAFALGRGNVGPHSIEAHGIRIGRYKPENEDWSHLTDHMLHRVEEDTYIGMDFFFWLMNNEWADCVRRGRNPVSGFGITTAYTMELQVAISIGRQGQRGFRLDTKTAWSDWVEIGEEMQIIFDKLNPHIPKRLVTEPMKIGHITDRCNSFSKAFRGDDNAWLGHYLKAHLIRPEARVGKRMPIWTLTTVAGDYKKPVKEIYPEMVGNINDTKTPLVAGAFTPLVWEDVGLGNLEYIKEYVLYPHGWEGVTYGETEEKWINNYKENPSGETSSPWAGKIDEESLTAWRARQEVPEFFTDIVNWYVLRSRRSQILNVKDMQYYEKNGHFPKQKNGKAYCKGLLAKAYSKEHGVEAWEYFLNTGEYPTSLDEEWRVPAEAFSIGTNTFRMRHKHVVNIPARGLRPLRHLFIAGKGKKIVGCDGAGLELRMLAHFMNDAIYTEIVLNGDIHSYNQELAGLPYRDMAKTFIYAFLYGSGVKNLAKVCGLSESDMRDRVERFRRELPALSNLIAACERAGEKYGYLHAIDGRWGRIRKSGNRLSIHTVLNVLLQMTGSLCMKYGLCLAERQMLSEGVALDEYGYPMFVANVHDEVQMEVDADEVETYSYAIPHKSWKAEEKRVHLEDGKLWSAPSKLGDIVTSEGIFLLVERQYHRAGEILSRTMEETGVMLGLRIPLAGEYKIGDSWHDTH